MNWRDWFHFAAPRRFPYFDELAKPANPLAGKALRYLIGADADGIAIQPEFVTVLPYDYIKPIRNPDYVIGYCNFFDEKNTGKLGPYLRNSDTAKEYGEGQIDPKGPGWNKNLTEQFQRRHNQGIAYIELDNPDAYDIKDVLGAIELASKFSLNVIAKNPILMGQKSSLAYVTHPNIYGAIVEKGAGNAVDMDALRRNASKPDLPVWFVAFGPGGSLWANQMAVLIKDHDYHNMGVTYSPKGEYTTAEHILRPR